MLEDLALGTSTRSVRLADAGVYTMNEVHIGGLLTQTLHMLLATDFNGDGVMIGAGFLPANRRIWGVTAQVQVTFGATGGLTGLLVGDAVTVDRWSRAAMALTAGTETSEGDFSDGSLVIYGAATDLWISGVGGLFDATGELEICIFSSLIRHPA